MKLNPARMIFIALVPSFFILFADCGGGGAINPGDGGGGGGGDGGGDMNDGGGPNPSQPVLRKNIGIDLAKVSSFIVISGSNNPSKSAHAGLTVLDTDAVSPGDGGFPVDGGGNNGPQLMALTLTGEVITVTMVEGGSAGVMNQPSINRIYPTPAWIFFSTGTFNVFKKLDDGGYRQIECNTIAARRSDGALFCTALGIRSAGDNYGNIDPNGNTVFSDATGDMAYFVSADSMNRNVVYKVAMDGEEGPNATLIDPALHPNWMAVNATGDLMVNSTPSVMDPTNTVTRILPVNGGAAISLGGTINYFAITGEPGAVDRDNYYVMSGGGGGIGFDGTIRNVVKSGNTFTDTPYTVTIPGGNNCSFLFRLSDGIYTFCELRLARVIKDGAVLTNAVAVPVTGADRLLGVGGLPMRFVPGLVVIVAGEGSAHKFIRHNGITQQDIPLDSDIDIMGLGVSAGGGINFFGVRISNNKKVMGTVPPGAVEVTIISEEEINAENVSVFTRIN